MSRSARKGGMHLAAFSLLLLAERPRHGLALHEDVNALLPASLQIDAGNLYRVLREMEKRGVVTSEWDTQGAGPARRVYAITPAGHDELAAWREDILARRQAFDIFLARHDALQASILSAEERSVSSKNPRGQLARKAGAAQRAGQGKE